MAGFRDDRRMTARLIDTLYVESMLLADEARGYFDEPGRTDRDGLSPLDRVTFACESLKVTTRLMHVIAWLLQRRAEAAGEIEPISPTSDNARLGRAAGTAPAVRAAMPQQARTLIEASIDLYDRIGRIERESLAPASPARALIHRLECSF